MEAEFDVVAGWTEEVVAALGPGHAIPAGCRGSGSPSALDWLAEALDLGAGSRILDAGAGVGGPAAYAAQRFGVRPVLVEPMTRACRAAARMFGLPVVAGSGEHLPVAGGAFDAAWCLGVLCTTSAKAALLAELRRVLTLGGRLGMLVFVQITPELPDAPEGNDSPTDAELADLLHAAGFDLVRKADAGGFAAAPSSWQRRVERVEQALAAAHGADPRRLQAHAQEQRMGRLLDGGHVAGRLVYAVAR
ncbi:class I SAM-dependent methyltransferase [Pseudonocardia sp. H11422]|uniref:class I SAM-dependent methyltransferase n=1 Tax=Pseudonocardia sp. H11422 TaxID=2835866 RepID=UPI001BDD6E92|nr:methyltransferase domain-containing protein [Pseudonocardia sp. H11422]